MNNYRNYGSYGNCGNRRAMGYQDNGSCKPMEKPGCDNKCPETKPAMDCGCKCPEEKPAMDCGCKSPEVRPGMDCGCKSPEVRPGMDCSCKCPEVKGEGNCGVESMYREMKNNEACGKCDDMEGKALAMAYVPWQSFRKLYEVCEGFSKGTIFKELDLDFYGRRCN